jgi:hypothetical protein
MDLALSEVLEVRGFSKEVIDAVMTDDTTERRERRLARLSKCVSPDQVKWYELIVQPDMPTLTNRIYPRDLFVSEIDKYENQERVKMGMGDIEFGTSIHNDLTELLMIRYENLIGRTLAFGMSPAGVYGIIAEIHAPVPEFQELKAFFKATGNVAEGPYVYDAPLMIKDFAIHGIYLSPVFRPIVN